MGRSSSTIRTVATSAPPPGGPTGRGLVVERPRDAGQQPDRGRRGADHLDAAPGRDRDAVDGTVVGGETAGRFTIAVLQGLYIVGLGVLVFRVNFGNPLAATVLVAPHRS